MLFADLVRFEDLLPIALFGMFAALAWWALDRVAGGRTRAVERLDALKTPRARRPFGEAPPMSKKEKVSKALEKVGGFTKALEPKSDLEKNKLKMKLANAGFRGEAASKVFYLAKLCLLLLGLFFGAGTVLAIWGTSQKGLTIAAVVVAVCLFLPDIVLSLIRKSRQEQIFLGLPDALDLMVVCVEAGLGLDQAMRKVAEEMKKSYPVVAEEFGIANLQLQMGRPRNEVLHELGARCGVPDVRALAAVLIQADKFGSSIATALRVQSDSMRVRRRQLAEEKAAKTAVKLIFPLVLFIFPGIFVILVGPAAVKMCREMLPMMEK